MDKSVMINKLIGRNKIYYISLLILSHILYLSVLEFDLNMYKIISVYFDNICERIRRESEFI